MSALPPKADIGTHSRNVRFVPKADKVRRSKRGLFDHLVGAGKQCRRYLQAKCFRGPEVDHELKFRRLYHWQVRRLGSLENPPNVDPLLAKRIRNVSSVTDEATGLGIVTYRIYRGNHVTRR